MKEVKIYEAKDRIEAEMIMEILRDSGIPSYRKSTGSGEIMNLYGANSFWAEEIWINEEQEKEAGEILLRFKEQ